MKIGISKERDLIGRKLNRNRRGPVKRTRETRVKLVKTQTDFPDTYDG